MSEPLYLAIFQFTDCTYSDNILLPIADVWNRSISGGPELTKFLEAFMNVQVLSSIWPDGLPYYACQKEARSIQMNALMTNATVPGSNTYGAD
jgi:hypothetical protein